MTTMPDTAATAARAAEMRLHLLVAAVVLALAGMAAAAQDAGPPINSKCPVLPEEDVDPSITVAWEGRTVALCCAKCQRKFLQDPQAYAPALAVPVAAAAGGAPPAAAAQAPPTAGQGHAHGPGVPNPAGAQHVPASPFLAVAGNVHVILVHFPIAMIFGAVLAELLALRRRRAGIAETTRFCLDLAAATAVLAATSGWLRAERHVPVLADVLERHRWLGVATAAFALACAVTARRASRSSARPAATVATRVLLLALAALTAITAHHGGMLVYGPDFPLGA